MVHARSHARATLGARADPMANGVTGRRGEGNNTRAHRDVACWGTTPTFFAHRNTRWNESG
eukprot:4178788-Lingulodinium_polyedra.AAC.1